MNAGKAIFGEATGGGYSAYFSGGGAGAGVCDFDGGAGWNCSPSAAQMNKHSEQVDPEHVLRQMAAMPLAHYGMEGARDETVRYLGPSTEDFKAAFDLGAGDQTTNSGNAQGVAFAAIQGLHRQLQAKDQEIAELNTKSIELETRLVAIESRLANQVALSSQDRGVLAGLQ